MCLSGAPGASSIGGVACWAEAGDGDSPVIALTAIPAPMASVVKRRVLNFFSDIGSILEKPRTRAQLPCLAVLPMDRVFELRRGLFSIQFSRGKLVWFSGGFRPMAVLDILRYPDSRLHTVAKPVDVVDDAVRRLVADMAETMYEAPGIGLAATQVNVHKRIIVIDVSDARDDLKVFINPEIVASSEESKVYEEGCLSVPGIYDEVERPDRVTVKALDLRRQRVRDRRGRGACGLPAARDRPSQRQGVRPVPLAAQAVAYQEQAQQAGSGRSLISAS